MLTQCRAHTVTDTQRALTVRGQCALYLGYNRSPALSADGLKQHRYQTIIIRKRVHRVSEMFFFKKYFNILGKDSFFLANDNIALSLSG